MSKTRIVERAAPLLAYLFAEHPETKKKQVREWLKFGTVAVNDIVVKQFDHPLKPGDQVEIRRKGMAAPESKISGGIRIRHEDADLLVIEKPAGLLSIASAAEDEKTAYALLTDHVRRGNPRGRERVWIVHRLDRDTSGLMVVAKNELAKVALQKEWESAEKKYFAVVEGELLEETGKLESHLDESNPLKVYSAPESTQTRHAITHFRRLKQGKTTTLLEMTLETGRRHQIRVQLADAGYPIVGDKKYGAQSNPIRRIALHASVLRFTHPTSRKIMQFRSPLPGELGNLVAPKTP